MFEKWLSRTAFVHEGFSAFKSELKEEDRRNTKGEKKIEHNVKQTKPTQSDQCPLADGTHYIWNCPLFKKMNINDHYI